MLLQVIPLVLAFSTCNVKVKGLNDAKYIAAAIYVTSNVLAVITITAYTLKEFVHMFPALFCTGFFIGTTSILGLVFVPKVCVRQMTSVTVLGFSSSATVQLLDWLMRHVCLLKPHLHFSVVEKLLSQLGSSYRKSIAIWLHSWQFYHNHATPPGADT